MLADPTTDEVLLPAQGGVSAPAAQRVFTVLIVDDDEAIRGLLGDLCEMEDYEVLTAENGRAGLEMIAAHPEIDCVILDVMMPELSGLEVLERVRSSSDHESLPIVLLTAAADDETTWAGWQQGASYYLSKPFQPDALLRHLSEIETNRRAAGVREDCLHSEWLTENWVVAGSRA